MERPSVRDAGFRLRATLGLFYFFGFLALFCVLIVGPALWQGFWSVSADPAQWESAQRAVQNALGWRFWLAVGLAAVATVAGGRLGVLPGTR